MDFFFSGGEGVFQVDNARLYRTNSVTDLFQELKSSFARFNWPPQSPDPNPIENTRDVLERDLRTGSTLHFFHQGTWRIVDEIVVTHKCGDSFRLNDSMIRRMPSVIRAKRGPTQY